MKRLSSFVAALFVASAAFSASPDSLTLSKCNPTLSLHLRKMSSPVQSRGVVGADAAAPLSLLVTCSNADGFVATLTSLGMKGRAITHTVATAHVPASRVAEVAALEGVKYMEMSLPAQALMDKARAAANVDAMHAGEGLESPFTGKGVVVGVIDHGFEYTHPAFSDVEGNLRISSIWNQSLGEEPIYDAEVIRSRPHDSYNGFHGNHVAGIAVGTHLPENDYGGVAPDAEIILVSSDFQTPYVLEALSYVREEARKAGKPFVTNMSFGSYEGSHDGLDSYSLAIDSLLGAGALNVAGIGNDGSSLMHASATLDSPSDTIFLPLDHRTVTSGNLFLILSTEREVTTPPEITAVLYNKNSRTISELPQEMEAEYTEGEMSPNPTTGKYVYGYVCYVPAPFLSEEDFLCLAITGGDAGQTYHAWIALPTCGRFLSEEEAGDLLAGDQFYMVMSPATSRRSLAIGAWCSKESFVNLNGDVVQFSIGSALNDVGAFSNHGPLLGDFSPKPLVCAPGATIVSAGSKWTDGFSETSLTVVDKVERNGEPFYYQANVGTSMASPFVAGALACWLQAYPELTPEEASDIVSRTAINDEFTGDARNNWDIHWGYGKFDAYAGLKECIALAHVTGVNAPLGEQPFTLSRGTDVWRICFNQPVSRATLVVTAADGSVRMQRTLSGVAVGHEETIALDSFTPGVYIVHMEADGVKWTRKFAR